MVIEKYLREALALREELQDHPGRAETLNSLGTLMQKKNRLEDAEKCPCRPQTPTPTPTPALPLTRARTLAEACFLTLASYP